MIYIQISRQKLEILFLFITLYLPLVHQKNVSFVLYPAYYLQLTNVFCIFLIHVVMNNSDNSFSGKIAFWEKKKKKKKFIYREAYFFRQVWNYQYNVISRIKTNFSLEETTQIFHVI